MTIAQLKKKVISEIQSTDDENVVLEIYELLRLESDNPEIYILSDGQISAIEDGREQVRNGQYLTHEEAKKDFKEWLKK
jgi:hypothetical protein